MAADEMRGARSDPISLCSLAHCSDQTWMIRQAEIVIAAKCEIVLSINTDMGALRTLQHEAMAVQSARSTLMQFAPQGFNRIGHFRRLAIELARTRGRRPKRKSGCSATP